MNTQITTTVYSCSGCSNVAQLANKIAVKLDRAQEAKMSCIAGVGGEISSLVKQAQNAKEILVIDGCHLSCAFHCLKKHSITPKCHIILTDFELTKNMHSDFSNEEFIPVYEKVLSILKNGESSLIDNSKTQPRGGY